MPKRASSRNPKRNRLLMLLMAPAAALSVAVSLIVARSAFPVSVMLAHSSRYPSPWPFAFQAATSVYATVLAISLFTEQEWEEAAHACRPLEILVGLTGFGIAAFILFGPLPSASWRDPRLGPFSGVASAAVRIPVGPIACAL